jgi:ferrous iron transport protein A
MILSEVKCGKKARIINLSSINQAFEKRLMDLNIVEGTEFTVKRTLFFGGPVAIEANGQHIGIRRNEAKKIFVEYVSESFTQNVL